MLQLGSADALERCTSKRGRRLPKQYALACGQKLLRTYVPCTSRHTLHAPERCAYTRGTRGPQPKLWCSGTHTCTDPSSPLARSMRLHAAACMLPGQAGGIKQPLSARGSYRLRAIDTLCFVVAGQDRLMGAAEAGGHHRRRTWHLRGTPARPERWLRLDAPKPKWAAAAGVVGVCLRSEIVATCHPLSAGSGASQSGIWDASHWFKQLRAGRGRRRARGG